MKFKEWRKLFMGVIGNDETDLKDDPDLESDIRMLYDKAREGDS